MHIETTGFASQALGYEEKEIDLNGVLNRNHADITFKGQRMNNECPGFALELSADSRLYQKISELPVCFDTAKGTVLLLPYEKK